MNQKTNTVSLLSLGIMIVAFTVPQLLFFWLAPSVACRITVYAFMTGYTLTHLLFCAFVWMQKGMRIASAPMWLSTVFIVIELTVCAILLAMNASPSTATYILVILGLIHFLAEAVLIVTLEQ